MGRPPRKNEAWLRIRYDAETLGAESFGADEDCESCGESFEKGYTERCNYCVECEDCCKDNGETCSNPACELEECEEDVYWHEGDKPYCYNCGLVFKKAKYSAESKLCESCNQIGNKFYGNTCSKCVYGDQEWCSNCGGMDCKKMPDGDWYCMNFLNNRETYDERYDAESFSAETFLANEMPFKSFWLVAKKGSKSFPAGQVGELRVYENGERTIVLDNNLIIPFYNQDLAYTYLNEHFMVYPKKGTADKGMLMRAEGDHDDHDHDHEDIDELIEKINRVTDFAITFIHDGGFGGEPKGIIIDEELGLKTEIVNYVEGSIDLRLVRDLETNELVSVRFALTGDPDETPILYLPLPERLTTVPEEERSVKES